LRVVNPGRLIPGQKGLEIGVRLMVDDVTSLRVLLDHQHQATDFCGQRLSRGSVTACA
jgi:hypothetical protein